VHTKFINVNDFGIADAFSTPKAPQSIGEHFSGGMLMTAVATVYEGFVRDGKVADEGEVLKSSIHGVASFGLMGFPWNNYMIS
jgi:hypothetical protein